MADGRTGERGSLLTQLPLRLLAREARAVGTKGRRTTLDVGVFFSSP